MRTAITVTSIAIAECACGLPEELANRPFLFAIRERFSRTIRFVGKIVDPGAE